MIPPSSSGFNKFSLHILSSPEQLGQVEFTSRELFGFEKTATWGVQWRQLPLAPPRSWDLIRHVASHSKSFFSALCFNFNGFNASMAANFVSTIFFISPSLDGEAGGEGQLWPSGFGLLVCGFYRWLGCFFLGWSCGESRGRTCSGGVFGHRRFGMSLECNSICWVVQSRGSCWTGKKPTLLVVRTHLYCHHVKPEIFARDVWNPKGKYQSQFLTSTAGSVYAYAQVTGLSRSLMAVAALCLFVEYAWSCAAVAVDWSAKLQRLEFNGYHLPEAMAMDGNGWPFWGFGLGEKE